MERDEGVEEAVGLHTFRDRTALFGNLTSSSSEGPLPMVVQFASIDETLRKVQNDGERAKFKVRNAKCCKKREDKHRDVSERGSVVNLPRYRRRWKTWKGRKLSVKMR